MNKFIISAAAGLVLFAALPALAQTYYPSTVCTTIAPTLSLGQSGSQVLSLQEFLVSQNYPGSGTWMETGYFGAATQAAVIDFQELHGLPQTGIVDSATASAITSASCGGTSYPYLQSTSPYPYSTSTTYPYNYNYYYSSTPVITSLSQNTGYPGQSVTISGEGFDPTGNTVTIGGTSVSGIASPTGTTLTFTIPYTSEYAYSYSYAGTPVQLSVSDSRGTSNAVSFTIYGSTTGNSYTCGSYPYYTATTYAYCPPQTTTTAPTISYLSPQSGGVGTSVTIYGSGFSTSGNTIHFGSAIIAGVGSYDGDSVSFVVPSTLTGYGSQPLTLSTYQISVTNSFGYTSNAEPFTVTSTGSTSAAPTISNVSGPTTLPVGQQGTWTVYVNNGSNQYLTFNVNWGDQNTYPYSSESQPTAYQTNTLTHTYYSAGTYTIQFSVSNSYGQSNTYTTTVQVGQNGSQGGVSLSYLSPTSGTVDTVVTIYGSGFAGYNTIYFGSGALQNVYSQSGTTLTFTVPSSVAPYCAQGSACPQYVQAVTPGTYPVSLENQNGTSNSLSFTVN